MEHYVQLLTSRHCPDESKNSLTSDINIIDFIDEHKIPYNDALGYVILSGYTEIIPSLLERGATLNKFGLFATHGNLDNYLQTFVALLNNGLNINAGDGYMLNLCTSRHEYDVAKFLMESGAEPRLVSDEVLRHVFYKIIYSDNCIQYPSGKTDALIKLVLSNRLDIAEVASRILNTVANNNHIELMQWLLDNGGNMDSVIENKLDLCVMHNHHDALRFLLKNGLDISMVENEYLFDAVVYNCQEMTQLLLENGPNLNKYLSDGSILEVAINRGRYDIVKLLLAHGADINAMGNRILQASILKGHLKITELLLQHGADISTITEETLFDDPQFSRSNQIDVVANINILHFLLKNGIAIRNVGGHVLHICAIYNYYDQAILLLDNGADVRACDDLALRTSAAKGNLELMCLFLQYGADINTRNGEALRNSATNGHFEMTSFLLQHGVVTDLAQLLIGCLNAAQFKIAHLLVEHGADITLLNDDQRKIMAMH